MEAGYNSHPSRLGAEAHYGEDSIFNQDGPYVASTPSYFFNSSSPIKPQSNLKGDNQPSEVCGEDTLARRLMILTNALNQGKPIRVDDLLSLRPDQSEVNYKERWIVAFLCDVRSLLDFLVVYSSFIRLSLWRIRFRERNLCNVCDMLQCDPKIAQLLSDLRVELRLIANSRPGGQLDPHLPVLNPPILGWSYHRHRHRRSLHSCLLLTRIVPSSCCRHGRAAWFE